MIAGRKEVGKDTVMNIIVHQYKRVSIRYEALLYVNNGMIITVLYCED